MNKLFLGLLVFIPIAIWADISAVSPVIVFFLAALAIVPLAKFIGEATEELATRTTPAVLPSSSWKVRGSNRGRGLSVLTTSSSHVSGSA